MVDLNPRRRRRHKKDAVRRETVNPESLNPV
jgi:hypothetical protein